MRRVGLLIKNASGIGLLCLMAACGNGDKPATRDLVQSPDELDPKTTENIRQLLDYAGTHKQLPDDSALLFDNALLSKAYQEREYKPIWGSREEWQPLADSLLVFYKRPNGMVCFLKTIIFPGYLLFASGFWQILPAKVTAQMPYSGPGPISCLQMLLYI